MFCERFLDRMQLAVFLQPFDGRDFFSLDDSHGNNARSDRPVAEYDGACSAQAFAAAALCPGNSKVGAQYP